MKFLASLVVLLGLSSGVFCACDWPNGTDTTLHWWEVPNSVFQVFTLTTQDANGNPEYPIHLSEPVYGLLNATNSGSAISQIQEDIALSEWDTSKCKWNTLPTFGLLNNLDGCTHGFTCPIAPGNQMLNVKIDFTEFQAIINLLKNDAPYQLQFTLTNKQTGDKIIFFIQARALIK